MMKFYKNNHADKKRKTASGKAVSSVNLNSNHANVKDNVSGQANSQAPGNSDANKASPPRRPVMHRGPGGPPVMHGGEKPRDFKGAFKRLLTAIKPYRLTILIVLLFSIGSTVFTILSPRILGQATTILFEGAVAKISQTGASIDFSAISRIIVILLMLYTISSVFNYVQGYLMAGISMKISYTFRRQISEKISRLPLHYFDKQTHGEVLSRVTNDVDTISNTLNQSLTQMVASFTTLLGISVMMLTISWQMTLAAILMLPLSMLLISIIVRLSQKYFVQQQAVLGQTNGHVEEMYAGHVVVKAYNGESRSIEKFTSLNDKLYQSAWKSQFFSGMMMPIMTFVGNLGYVIIVIIGGWLAMQRMITVGNIQAFIQYIRQFTQPIQQVANIATILQSTMAASERVFEFLEEEEESADTGDPADSSAVEGRVTFSHVRFGYLPDKTIIKDFSLDVKPGQRVAIVGPTGAGKTTLVKLLMRFYDVNSGQILIDGKDIKAYTRADLRSLFGMVLQDTWLFNGTIRDNIRYGRLDASDEAVEDAAKTAYVDHFIHTLPHGYDMVLNEEISNISQGQKQLITIARAVLANPKIMILDEATSSVDTRTEVLIQKGMLRLMENRTSFIIAHRLSTIRDADLILALKDGDIVEQGTHSQLLAANGFYADLYNSQFETSSD